MGQAIQFRGVIDIVAAYKMNDMAPWAIACGKTIIQSYDDDDIEAGGQALEGYLKLLKRGGSEGKYTLYVYRYKDGLDIDSSTPWKRGFGFTLWELDGDGRFTDRAGFGEKALSDRMDRLEEIIVNGAEEKEEGGIGGMMAGIMKLPGIQQAIGAIAMNLVGKIMPMHTQPLPAKVAGLQGSTAEMPVSLLTPEQSTKAQQALDLLCTLDPLLGDNLLKVAAVARDNPAMYTMFTTQFLK